MFKGKGTYHYGPGGIEQPGDFGYRIDTIDGVEHVQFAMYCPKFGVCLTKIHHGPPDAENAIWQWDGHWESPSIVPSIGCDLAPRCGQHTSVVAGRLITKQ